MSPIQARTILAGLFFLFIFLSGYGLQRSGKPYSTLILTIHKLLALAALAFFIWTVYQVNQAVTLSALELSVCVISGILFLGTIISGGLVSIDREMPAMVRTIHQFAPRLTLLSFVLTFYLLIGRV